MEENKLCEKCRSTDCPYEQKSICYYNGPEPYVSKKEIISTYNLCLDCAKRLWRDEYRPPASLCSKNRPELIDGKCYCFKFYGDYFVGYYVESDRRFYLAGRSIIPSDCEFWFMIDEKKIYKDVFGEDK